MRLLEDESGWQRLLVDAAMSLQRLEDHPAHHRDDQLDHVTRDEREVDYGNA